MKMLPHYKTETTMTTVINNTYKSGTPTIEISPDFLDLILKPYRNHAKYLHEAEITHFLEKLEPNSTTSLITARGKFSIPESCYIDDTGHFNAVEFNICFNQLAYVMFGKCLQEGIFQRLIPIWESKIKLDYDIFLKQQLSSMLIVKIEGKFLKQLDSDGFFGEISIDKVISSNDAHFAYTTVSFSDEDGVKCKGSVVLAFNPIHE